MNNIRFTYRAVLIFSVLSALTGIAISITGFENLPDELASYQALMEDREPEGIELFFGLFSLVLFLIIMPINIIGLWLFKNWARLLFLGLTALSLVGVPFMGPIVVTPWVALFSDLSLISTGILIAMLFSPKLMSEFGVIGE